MIKRIKALLLDSDGGHYSSQTHQEINNTSTKLFYSRYGNWTSLVFGKLAVKIKDDGNGARLWIRGRGNMGYFNYSQLHELQLALDEYNESTNLAKPVKRVVIGE